MYSYKQVERALATAFNIQDHQLGAFRGRINNFKNFKIVPSSPGTGHKIKYELSDVFTWAICLEFSQFGMDPKSIFQYLHFVKKDVVAYLTNELSETERNYFDNDYALLLFHPYSLSKPPLGDDTVYYSILRADEFHNNRLIGNRAGIINLSMLQDRVNQALDDVSQA